MATGTVSEQVQLLLLDPALNLAPGAIEGVIECLGFPFQIGDYIEWVDALLHMFDLGNHPALAIPAAGGVREFGVRINQTTSGRPEAGKQDAGGLSQVDQNADSYCHTPRCKSPRLRSGQAPNEWFLT